MPTPEQHINQWRHNRSFLATIPSNYPDWIATVSFYVALQAVDALLAKSKHTHTSHSSRNEILQTTHTYQKIWNHYHPLYQLSRTIRYSADPSKWIRIENIESQIWVRNLYEVEKSVRNLLNKDSAIFPPFEKITLNLQSPPTPR